MSDMLADVINAGTAAQARALGFTLPAAGKTGTTNNFNDAWFVGYTPHLVVGVWVGSTRRTRSCGTDLRRPSPCRCGRSSWPTATRGDKPEWFRVPRTVVAAEICPESGRLATTSCEAHRRHYFVGGTRAGRVTATSTAQGCSSGFSAWRRSSPPSPRRSKSRRRRPAQKPVRTVKEEGKKEPEAPREEARLLVAHFSAESSGK